MKCECSFENFKVFLNELCETSKLDEASFRTEKKFTISELIETEILQSGIKEIKLATSFLLKLLDNDLGENN